MSATPSRDWDAASYDRVSDPQLGWALEQLERLPLAGDEVVLDAGCGSGRVTALLADRVPRGKVYAVDVAPSMVEHARAALGERATVAVPGPDRAGPARVGRRDLLERHVSLDPRPRCAVRRAGTDAEAGRAAGGAVRRAREHRLVSDGRGLRRHGGAVRSVLRRLAAAVELRHRFGHRAAADAGRVRGRRLLAPAEGRHPRRPARVRAGRFASSATSTPCRRSCRTSSSIGCCGAAVSPLC